TKMSSKRARFGCDAFLHATVAGETDAMLIKDAALRRVETRRRHLHRHRDADCVAHPLPERPGGAFHAGRFTKLRMPRRLGMQLAEPFDLRHRQIVTAHVQPRVKEHAAVAGREDEVTAIYPAAFV